ncbi:hypothetical protein, partial [uncultured Pelagibacterium sp.]|uniref:hypothetical protein n=1 Tax=uncultured Pelagibacterium sp. TaxID=1159875 RepID=UPI0030D8B9B1
MKKTFLFVGEASRKMRGLDTFGINAPFFPDTGKPRLQIIGERLSCGCPGRPAGICLRAENVPNRWNKPMSMSPTSLSHLSRLESESIEIFR